MRVVYFTESLYPLVDGVSRTLARLFDTLLDRGVEFRVFSPFVPAADEVVWRDRVRRVGYVRFPPYPDYRISLPFSRGITEELDDFAPDLIHVVSPTPLARRAQRLGRRRGIPVVASFHTHFVSYFRYYGIGPLEPLGWSVLRGFYRPCARVYAPSPSIVRELTGRGVKGVELWSRGIDLTGFSPDHRDPRIVRAAGGDDDTPVLLLVSRLVKEKDLADLVQIDRTLKSRGVSYSLALVGDGPMRGKLQRALPDAVFPGHQSGAELARWYAAGDVFVFPSTTETLGNVVLEALASGLPAVVSDKGGPQDLIESGSNGYVVPANDVEAMADRLQMLLQDTALRRRMSAAARASAASRDWSEINGALLESYSEVVREARARAAR